VEGGNPPGAARQRRASPEAAAPAAERLGHTLKVFYPPFSRKELLAALGQRLPALQGQLPLKRVVLFGSWAKGRHTVA
jgi:hypothetical protein